MMKLKSSAQIKRRYLLIDSENKEAIENAILDYIGILGWAKASPVFVDCMKKDLKNKFVLSVDRKSVANVRAAIELSKNKIKILKVSGTLKGLIK